MWSMKFWSILREVDIEILVSLRNLLTFYEIQPKDHNRYSTKSFSVRHTVDIFLRQPPEQCPETTIPKNFSSAKITLGCAVLSHFSCAQLFTTLQAVACQATLSMGFPRHEHWSGLPCPPQRIFLTQRSNLHLLHFLHWQVGSLPLVPPERP